MTPRERLIFCGIVGTLLLEDEAFTAEEETFLRSVMAELSLADDILPKILDYARSSQDKRADIEHLRRNGHADRLVETLRNAALADGVIQSEEQALIDHVQDVLRLRLGVDNFPLELAGLQHEPLDALYDIEGQIGEGTYGLVYLATSKDTSERVVIKKLRASIMKDSASLKRAGIEDRFWREVLVMRELSSPYVVRCLGAGFDVNTPYMVLEYIEGDTLFGLLNSAGALPHERARRLMHQVIHAIANAHSQGIIHRDLKPENVMIASPGTDDEVARVVDFGLAGIMAGFEQAGHVPVTRKIAVGTPAYMPPEQIREISKKRPQNDVYALGLLLLESLTGRSTIVGDGTAVVRFQVSSDPVPIPDDVRETVFGPVIERAVHKDWKERYASAVEMLEDFEAHTVGDSGKLMNRFWSGLKKLVGR